MSYPNEILSTRAVVHPGLYAVLPSSGRVNNVIPGLQGVRTSILASPKLGAGFVQYIMTLEKEGGTTQPYEAQDVEKFLYVIDGNLTVETGKRTLSLSEGGYYYCPAGQGLEFKSTSAGTRILLYKQKYTPLAGYTCFDHSGNVNDIEYRNYENMENVLIKDLLPTDLSFDINMHILSFKPGGCHPFIETHVQEHGAYVLEGEGLYLINGTWLPIQKDDFIWFGAFVTQGAYGVGTRNFTYIYSKDCNRDAAL